MKTLLTTLAILTCGIVITNDVQAKSYAGIATLKGETLQDADFKGIINLSEVKADSLNITGTLEFNNLEVKNDTTIVGPTEKSKEGKFNNLKITGPFEATNVACTKLDVMGPVMVTNLTVEKEATIIGGLEVNKGSLNNLTITSEKVVLKDVDVNGNITVKKDTALLGMIVKDQVLELQGKAIVKGTITFESGTGKIVQAKDAKIEGAVTGAVVEKK